MRAGQSHCLNISLFLFIFPPMLRVARLDEKAQIGLLFAAVGSGTLRIWLCHIATFWATF